MDGGSLSTLGLDARLTDLSSSVRLNEAVDAARVAGEGRAVDAAHQFEALLATTLVREMRRGLSDGFFGDGPGADTFEGWLDEHVGRALSESGSLDLAGVIKVNLGIKQSQTTAQQEPTQ